MLIERSDQNHMSLVIMRYFEEKKLQFSKKNADKRLSEKVARLVKANVNIKREMPISKASRVYSGKFSRLNFFIILHV